MRRWPMCVVLLGLVVLLAAVMPGTALAGPLVAVKIAVAGPLGTEGATVMGAGMKRGVDLAASDYAQQLASAGVTISVAGFDDEGEPQAAVTAANGIVADNLILGVVGHLNSGCSIPASKVYALAHLSMVTPISTNPALTQQGLNNVFRTCATDAGQGPYAADIVVKHLRLTRVYVVDDTTPYGTGLSSGFAKRLKADGVKVLAAVAHTSYKQTNFSALVQKIKAKKPTIVYYGGIYPAGGLLARQLKKAGVKALFVGGDGVLDPTFVTVAGKNAAEGALASTVGLPLSEMPGGAAFVAETAAAHPGQSPILTDAYSYDAAQAIIKAIIEVAQETSPSALVSPTAREQVRAKVAASNFGGITGSVAFNSAGDTKFPAYSSWRVKAGTWKGCAQVSKPVVPASVKRNVAFTVYGTLNPAHFPGAKVITLRFWRKVGTKWVLGKTQVASVSGTGLFSKYSASVKLVPAGTWRVVATHADGSHPSMDSVVDIFKVK